MVDVVEPVPKETRAVETVRVEESTRQTPRRWEYLAILSLLAASFMVFQIAVLRELRYQLSTIFTLTPFLFSSVIIFIGLGAIAARWIRTGARTVLRWGVALLPLVVIPLFAVTMAVAQGMIDHTGPAFSYGLPQGSGNFYMDSIVLAFVAVALLGYGPLFFLQGLIFAHYFQEGRRTGVLSQVYAVDLVASGCAALAGGILSFYFTPVGLVLLAAGSLLVNLFVACRYLRIRVLVVAVETVLVLAMIGGELTARPLERLESPRWLGAGLVYSHWSPYRRIDVVDDAQMLQVYTDGLLFHVYDKSDSKHLTDPRAVPVRSILPPDPTIDDVLVIGAGTGSDVRILRDLVPRDLNVVAVELDHGFVETARTFPWLWDYYRTADIVVQEGRYFLENTEQTFDLVMYAYIDPQSAISKVGLPDANFLYSDEGIRSAYERVRDGGYLVITRVFLVERGEAFIKRFCATLESAGISPTQTNIYRHKSSIAWGYYGNLSTFHAVVRKGGTPPTFEDDRIVAVDWVHGGRPTTDLFPFSLLTGDWFGQLVDYVKGNILILTAMIALLLCLTLRLATSASHASFFLLGLGSFLVECQVLFNSFLLIGNPSLSAAVAVGFFLFWNGLGSLFSNRFAASRCFFALVPVVVVLYGISAPLLNSFTIASPLWLRIVAFAGHLAIPGVIVGAMFPIGLRIFLKQRVSSLFFIDLVGCALAPVVFWAAMSYSGVISVGLGATAAYGILAWVFLSRR